MKTIKITLICMLVAGFSCLHAQHKLGYKFKLGDEYRISQKAIQNITMTMGGEVHNLTNTLEGIFSFTVSEVHDDHYIIETSFETMKFSTTSDIMGTLNDVDTARDASETDMEAQIFKGLINVPFYMTMQKDGHIVKIDGVDDLLESMIRNAGIEDESTKAMVKEGVSKQFGSESLSSSMEQFTYIYPSNKVTTADTWQNEFTGDLTAQNTWSLDGYSNSEIKISGAATIQLKVTDESMNMELEGTQDSSVLAYSGDGFINTVVIEQRAEGVSRMMGVAGDIETKIDSKITYKKL
ncbi:hypothetical protein J1N09_07660 [Aureitalea sp. L0-47]|uniref:DUF6263 family protein n=1 Tax=Aureitalea sp. L0-47 TaxID=2816962 RepID=UPI002238DD99|nr:DUF6263 family protein [Aureitalea sp. L0-47]MCW5519710.1 hypothetical protein [Aureitalea sp. L0-47]